MGWGEAVERAAKKRFVLAGETPGKGCEITKQILCISL
jgi:hypothetical protein